MKERRPQHHSAAQDLRDWVRHPFAFYGHSGSDYPQCTRKQFISKPAMSGALPPLGSYMCSPSPSDAEGLRIL